MSNNGCSVTLPVEVSVVAMIDIVASSNSPQCASSDSELRLFASDGYSSYSWTGPDGFISGEQNPVIYPVTEDVEGTYIVTVFTTTCGTVITTTDVTVNPLPEPTLAGPLTPCINSTGNVYTTELGMSDYIWQVTGGTITSGLGTNSITVTWYDGGTQVVSVNYGLPITGCRADEPTELPVTVTEPIPTFTAGPVSVCVLSTGNTYMTETGMTNYQWIVSPGGQITEGGGNGDNSVTITWNTVGAQSVSVNYTTPNGCTASALTLLNVDVKPLPVVTLSDLLQYAHYRQVMFTLPQQECQIMYGTFQPGVQLLPEEAQ